MQEQVNDKTVTLVVKCTKLTSRLLAKAISKLLAENKQRAEQGNGISKCHVPRVVADLLPFMAVFCPVLQQSHKPLKFRRRKIWRLPRPMGN